jgi:putative transposase
MVSYAGEWPWSSYNATKLNAVNPRWLAVDFMLSLFGQNQLIAIQQYKNFVNEGGGMVLP